MKSTKICIVGTQQTGSTRLFNLVRMIYIKKGNTVYSRWNLSHAEMTKMSGKYDIFVSKIHDVGMDYLNDFDIKLLPIRNIIDSAISLGARLKDTSTKAYIRYCNQNIGLFNKFKSVADFIFIYENYNVHYIKKLCATLNINLDNDDIIDIMIQLDSMHNSKDIVIKDDATDKEYQKNLLSQDHNTSNGKTNKFINMPKTQLNDILKENTISTFLEENFYL